MKKFVPVEIKFFTFDVMKGIVNASADATEGVYGEDIIFND